MVVKIPNMKFLWCNSAITAAAATDLSIINNLKEKEVADGGGTGEETSNLNVDLPRRVESTSGNGGNTQFAEVRIIYIYIYNLVYFFICLYRINHR